MAKLPLKLRIDIRDHWEKEDCPAQKSIASLKDLLGLPVSIQVDFPILWGNLEKFHPDQSTFVPSITTVIKSWTDCLATRLADDANAAWTEQLLEHVCQGSKSLTARVESAAAHAQDTGDDNDCPDVTVPSRTRGQASAMTSTALPSIHELPRPEILFASQAPYHLIVKIVHDGIVVQGSHQGSLELLSGYLQKYTRNIDNPSIRRPIVKYELQTSLFGYGGLSDCLRITVEESRSGWVKDLVNPVLVLSFVESVLGYTSVESASGESQWYFKRDVGFEK